MWVCNYIPLFSAGVITYPYPIPDANQWKEPQRTSRLLHWHRASRTINYMHADLPAMNILNVCVLISYHCYFQVRILSTYVLQTRWVLFCDNLWIILLGPVSHRHKLAELPLSLGHIYLIISIEYNAIIVLITSYRKLTCGIWDMITCPCINYISKSVEHPLAHQCQSVGTFSCKNVKYLIINLLCDTRMICPNYLSVKYAALIFDEAIIPMLWHSCYSWILLYCGLS